MTHKFELKVKGPFDLLYENEFFGGWLSLSGGDSIVITMPIEGWKGSAAVVMTQRGDLIQGEVYGKTEIAEQAWKQALACLSLDIDGGKWEDVGKRDEFIDTLQRKYQYLRPVLFHSPYEAAVSLIIGQRISIRQRRAIMQRMSEAYGEAFTINGQTFHAFPDPYKLLEITSFPSLNDEKILRIHGAAQAAIDGLLSRNYLRSLSPQAALGKLLGLRGVGAFYSEGIFYRGAGIVNDITRDVNTLAALQKAYDFKDTPTKIEIDTLLEKWQPYPMWCIVLIHVWMRREQGGFPSIKTQKK